MASLSQIPLAVASKSFSRDPRLREELAARYANIRWNTTGRALEGDELIAFLIGHVHAITGLDRLDERVFQGVPELRLVSKYGVGLDMIDLEAARRHGVTVRWTPGVNRQAVAELAIAFMIALTRRMVLLANDVRAGVWRQPGGRQISSATIGIVGCGHVGQAVARLCRAFGARVIAYDIRAYDEFYRAHGITPVDFDTLLAQSDIVTLHVPLDSSTRGMIGERQLKTMKPTAFLINTARGGIVDETAVKVALRDERLAGAAFDVFINEPPLDRELIEMPTVIATPHIGASTDEAVLAMGRAAIAGLEGSPDSIDLTANVASPRN